MQIEKRKAPTAVDGWTTFHRHENIFRQPSSTFSQFLPFFLCFEQILVFNEGYRNPGPWKKFGSLIIFFPGLESLFRVFTFKTNFWRSNKLFDDFENRLDDHRNELFLKRRRFRLNKSFKLESDFKSRLNGNSVSDKNSSGLAGMLETDLSKPSSRFFGKNWRRSKNPATYF